MLNLFAKDPYTHIIAFIDAAVESGEISAWLAALEKEPDHMRTIRLAEIKHNMQFNQAPEQHIEIIELMNSFAVLQAMNNVIWDVHDSGMSTKKFIKKRDNSKYNLLISLIASANK